MKKTLFVRLILIIFLVSTVSTDVYSLELPNKPTSNSYALSSKTAYPDTTPGFSKKINGGTSDGFVIKLDAYGETIEYATYIGGNGADRINSMAVDEQGFLYVGGLTNSHEGTFPIEGDIPGFQKTFIENPSGGDNGFLLKLNPEGTDLEYSTYLRTGSTSDDIFLTTLSVDKEGCLFVAGETTCDKQSFPVGNEIPGFESKQKGFYDGFVLKLDPLGSSILYSTLIDGTGYDSVVAIETDASSALYLTGVTIDALNHKKDFSFPVGPEYPGYNTIYHANGTYLMKLDPLGTSIEYSTMFLQTSIFLAHIYLQNNDVRQPPSFCKGKSMKRRL